VQTSGVPGHRALPSDRNREHERVQARVVEALADVAAGGEHDARLITRRATRPRDAGHGRHAALQDHELRDTGVEQFGQRVELDQEHPTDRGRRDDALIEDDEVNTLGNA